MLNHLSDTFSSNLMNTGVTFLVVLLTYLMVNLIFIRKIDNQKRKKTVRIRAFYVAVLVFLFFMARIWVNGFMHLIAVLGLVSAGLVVTNKETIMNLVGWMIITWRGVFSEDDLIQIQAYKGYVKSIGVLYITLREVSDADFSRLTGKEIKVPNGLTANNAVINYSQTARLVSADLKFKVAMNRFSQVEKAIAKLITKTLTDFYEDNRAYTQAAIVRFDRTLRNKIDFAPCFTVSDNVDSDGSATCVVSYYCFAEDKRVLTNKLAADITKCLASKD